MFIDVLHHTSNAQALLEEAGRVGKFILIKDHFKDGVLADATLRLMDWVGNARYGVSLPYNYWPNARWLATFKELGWNFTDMKIELSLYPAPLSWFFDRHLHFIVRCEPAGS
jgi:hypothetical protein